MTTSTPRPREYVADALPTPLPPAPRTVRDLDEAADRLTTLTRRRIAELTANRPGRHGLLLSGGVDSMVVAAALVEAGHRPEAVTFVATIGGEPLGTDLDGACGLAAALDLHHEVLTVDVDELPQLAAETVAALGTTDVWEVCAGLPFTRCAQGLRALQADGLWWTGGGADVLLGGGKTFDAPDSPDAAARMDTLIDAQVAASFTRNRYIPDFYERLLGADQDRLVLTYQTHDAWETTRSLHPTVLWREGHDKAALRAAAERLGVPHELAWRPKDPLQRSSGLFDAFEAAARQAAAKAAGPYTDPLVEPAGQVASRLWLASLR